jgi:branched-chain amino acid transport system substrate-binding protein
VMDLSENKSLSIVSRQYFNGADVSIAAQLTNVKASGADVLFTWATGTPQATVLRGYNDAGLTIPIISSPGNLTYAQMKQYATFLPSEQYFPGNPAFAYDRLPTGPVKRAVSQYLTTFKQAGIQPDMAHLFAWNSAMIVIEALRKYGTSATAEQIRSFIADYHGAGASGPEDFRATPQRGISVDSIMMLRWDPAKNTWVGVSSSDGKPLR